MGRNPASFSEIGVDGGYDFRYGIRTDDIATALRGVNGLKKYREMRENDSTVGAIIFAIETLAKGAIWNFTPSDIDNPLAVEHAAFMDDVMNDMEFTFDDFISDAMTFLSYGFSAFEIVTKRREDGRIGVKKLGPRAQWTVERFAFSPDGSQFEGMYQQTNTTPGLVMIPKDRLLLFRPTSSYADPAGRSILRNAYRDYVYLTHIEEYEAVAIERELNGLPVGRVPSSYLRADASDSQKAFVTKFKQILRDVKKNEQGYVLLPSDLYENEDGSYSAQRQVEFELLASKGTRDIDPSTAIVRHQQNIARSVLADFITLGMNDRGSFSMSKSKSDVFVKAMKSFLNSIASPVDRTLTPLLWKVNNFPKETMPKLTYQNLAPIDLDELGKYLRSLALAGAQMFPDDNLENAARTIAGMPPRTTQSSEMSDDFENEPKDDGKDLDREGENTDEDMVDNQLNKPKGKPA